MDQSDEWILLSNRLLLLQEIMVGLSQLPFAEVITRAASGITWIFDSAILQSVTPDALASLPLVSRGRTMLEDFGEVYLAYFAGPPEPCYLILSGVPLIDPQEFRLAALYFEHLLAALAAAGYREELAKQARTDWLTGLPNRHSLILRLGRKAEADVAVGLLELSAPRGLQAETDTLLQEVAATLRRLARGSEKVLRTGTYRFAWLLPQARLAEVNKQLFAEGLPIVSVWAEPPEGEAETFAQLFGRAEGQLEQVLRQASKEALAVTSEFSALQVHCGTLTLQRAWQERVQAWPIAREAHLILDQPHGFALEQLEAGVGPALVVTDSPSEPYIRDLLAQKPQGVIVGTPADEEILEALQSVLTGKDVYQGPKLSDDGLYPRERTVWRLVIRGLSNAEIATQLKISEKTVANYVTNLQDKLFLDNRVELVLFYLGKLERETF